MQIPAAGQMKSELMVAGKETPETGNRHFKIVFARKGHDTHVIRPRPVKGGTLNQQDFFLQQKIEHHLLVIVNIKALSVDFREHI